MSALDRRAVLRLGAAGAVAAGGFVVAGRLSGSPTPFGPPLAQAFSDPSAVAALGRGWLGQVPAEQGEPRALWAYVHATLGTSPASAAAEVLARASDLAVLEFADDRTVVVDGWLLSAMQANIAALVAHEV